MAFILGGDPDNPIRVNLFLVTWLSRDDPGTYQMNRTLIAILIALQLITLPMALHELAMQANVDPAQAACVVKHESDWDINERGDLDERGLFQLLPSTAIWVASEMGWQGFTLEWLDDPVKNMEMGIYILKRWPNWYSVIDYCR